MGKHVCLYRRRSYDYEMATRTSIAGRRRSTKLAGEAKLRITVDELKYLMELRGAEAAKYLHDQYGGVVGLCDMLATSPTDGMTVKDKSCSVKTESTVVTKNCCKQILRYLCFLPLISSINDRLSSPSSSSVAPNVLSTASRTYR